MTNYKKKRKTLFKRSQTVLFRPCATRQKRRDKIVIERSTNFFWQAKMYPGFRDTILVICLRKSNQNVKCYPGFRDKIFSNLTL